MRFDVNIFNSNITERAGCHPTYIGQVECGEKNATMESVERIAFSLGISPSRLFEGLGGEEKGISPLPLAAYEMLLAMPQREQEQFYRILLAIKEYKES